jgi:hypothetical protein
VHDRDKTGKTRIRCSAVRKSGNCSNRRIFYLSDVEMAVLEGMAEELKDPAEWLPGRGQRHAHRPHRGRGLPPRRNIVGDAW